MSLRSKFLAYVEYQRAAEEYRLTSGPLSPMTKSMFDEANRRKAEILELIDQYEPELDPAKRDWYYDGDGTKRKKDDSI